MYEYIYLQLSSTLFGPRTAEMGCREPGDRQAIHLRLETPPPSPAQLPGGIAPWSGGVLRWFKYHWKACATAHPTVPVPASAHQRPLQTEALTAAVGSPLEFAVAPPQQPVPLAGVGMQALRGRYPGLGPVTIISSGLARVVAFNVVANYCILAGAGYGVQQAELLRGCACYGRCMIQSHGPGF